MTSSIRQPGDGRRNSDPAISLHELPPSTSVEKKPKRRFFGANSSTNSTIDGRNATSEEDKIKKGKN
jgi:hypothetical protein